MKTMKKFGAFFLALVLCLSLCSVAFADTTGNTDEGNYGSITINNAEMGETYSVYQIFDLTYSTHTNENSNDISSYSYKVVDAWEDFISGYTITVDEEEVKLFTLDSNGYLDPDSAIYDYENDSDVLAAFAQAALAYAGENGIEATASETVDGVDGRFSSLNFEGLDLGWYLIDSSLGSLCILTSTAPDAVVNEKNSVPTLNKWVDVKDQTEEDVENASTHSYILEIENIKGAVNLKLDDIMDPELEMDVDSMEVKLIDGEAETTLTLNSDYTYTYTNTTQDQEIADHTYVAGSHELKIDFTAYDFSNVSDSAYIEISYYCTVHTEGDSYEGDVDEVHNVAMISYGSSGQSEWEEADVKLFGFEIYKYTGTEVAGESYLYTITDTFSYDANVGDNDRYCLVYLDQDTETVYYAIFDTSTYTDLNVNGEFIITDWTTDSSGATTVAEGDIGKEVTWTFYTNTLPNNNADEHIVEVLEIEGNSAIGPQEITDDENPSNITVGSALAGAEFSLTNSEGKTAYFEKETVELSDGSTKDIYLFVMWVDGVVDSGIAYPAITSTLVSGEDGMIYVEGLTYGTYTLTETKAPDGYNLMEGSIDVEIDQYGNVFYSTSGIMNEGNQVADKIVNVLNNAGSELPGTGGIGTTIFYVLGGIIVVGAVVVLVTRKRMGAAE